MSPAPSPPLRIPHFSHPASRIAPSVFLCLRSRRLCPLRALAQACFFFLLLLCFFRLLLPRLVPSQSRVSSVRFRFALFMSLRARSAPLPLFLPAPPPPAPHRAPYHCPVVVQAPSSSSVLPFKQTRLARSAAYRSHEALWARRVQGNMQQIASYTPRPSSRAAVPEPFFLAFPFRAAVSEPFSLIFLSERQCQSPSPGPPARRSQSPLPSAPQRLFARAGPRPAHARGTHRCAALMLRYTTPVRAGSKGAPGKGADGASWRRLLFTLMLGGSFFPTDPLPHTPYPPHAHPLSPFFCMLDASLDPLHVARAAFLPPLLHPPFPRAGRPSPSQSPLPTTHVPETPRSRERPCLPLPRAVPLEKERGRIVLLNCRPSETRRKGGSCGAARANGRAGSGKTGGNCGREKCGG